jgi:hypothetical protein
MAEDEHTAPFIDCFKKVCNIIEVSTQCWSRSKTPRFLIATSVVRHDIEVGETTSNSTKTETPIQGPMNAEEDVPLWI